MERMDLMLRSGVMHEWKRRPRYYKPAFRFDKGVVQPDKSWQVIALAAVIVLACAVLTVRWWLCV